MPNEVTISVVGKDAGAKATMDQAAQQGKRVADSLGNIGQVIGGEFLGQLAQNAFGKLNQFLMASVEAAKGAAAAEAQLGATLQSTGGAAGLSADQIKSMASELQSLTNFEDDAILSSSNLLLTFTQIAGDTFPRAQRAVLDVSQAMGQDLQSATILVGKALNDPIRGVTALTRAGVQLTQAQKDQIATMVEAGDVAGAQAMILQELETQFGGSAEAAVAADGGITQMTNSIGDMQEEIGAKLLPVMVKWTEAKLTVLEAILALPGPLQLVVAGVTALSLGALLLVPRIMAARAALLSMGVAAGTANRMLGAIGLILTVAVGAVAAFGATQREAVSDTEALTASLDRQTGAVTRETGALIAEGLERRGVLEIAREHRVALEDITAAAAGEADAQERVTDAIARAREALDQQRESHDISTAAWRQGQTQLDLLEESLTGVAGELESSQERWQREAEAAQGATHAVDLHIDSLQALSDQLRAQIDPAFALIQAQEDLAAAQQAVTEAEQEHGRQSPEYEAALRDEAQAALDVLHAAGQLGDEITGDLSSAQRQMLRDAGLSEAAIDRLAADLRRAKRDADRLDGTRARITIQTSYTTVGQPPQLPAGGQSVFHAGGGPVGAGMQSGGVAGPGRGFPDQPGSMTWVGEQGPELVRLPLGSTVIPAGQSQAMIGGNGGAVQVQLVIDSAGSRIDDLLVEVLLRALRTSPQVRDQISALVSR